MTESLYCSISIIWSYFLLNAPQRKLFLVASLVLVILLVFMRPNGWMLFLIQGLWILKQYVKLNKTFVLISVVVSVSFLLIVWFSPFSQKMIHQQSLIHWKYGTIIWGYWEWRYPLFEDSLVLTWNTLFEGFKIATIRVALEISGIRPYFSLAHNVVVGFYMLSVHLLAIISLFKKRLCPLEQLSAFLFLGQFAIVAATFADWEGRFAYQILPFTVVLASFQIERTGKNFMQLHFNGICTAKIF